MFGREKARIFLKYEHRDFKIKVNIFLKTSKFQTTKYIDHKKIVFYIAFLSGSCFYASSLESLAEMSQHFPGTCEVPQKEDSQRSLVFFFCSPFFWLTALHVRSYMIS